MEVGKDKRAARRGVREFRAARFEQFGSAPGRNARSAAAGKSFFLRK